MMSQMQGNKNQQGRVLYTIVLVLSIIIIVLNLLFFFVFDQSLISFNMLTGIILLIYSVYSLSAK